MATATTKSRAAKQLARRAREVRVADPMQFLIFEDNGGDYHWTLVARDGATLARSGSFASYDDAEHAADAERWLDEGGSFSSHAVAKWQAPH
jgi:uncharacterized protein YegP (UPF0339 family)